MKRFLIAVALCVAAAVVGTPGGVHAYDNDITHQYICGQATTVFAYPELADYLPDLKYGAYDEDETDHVWDLPGIVMTCTHFWDADEGDDDLVKIPIIGIEGIPNAWMKAQELLAMGYAAYFGGDKQQGYEYFGHVAHLLQDQSVPAHVHEDFHPGHAAPGGDDCYEDWMEDNQSNWNGQHALNAGGLIPLPADRLAAIPHLEPFKSPYYLFYLLNQYTDYFASDSNEDGDTWDRWGWVDYSGFPGRPVTSGQLENNDEELVVYPPWILDDDNDDDDDLSKIGRTTFVTGIRATATLCKAIRDYIDDQPPTTTITVLGDAGNNGWHLSDVTVWLLAKDNAGGQGTHEIYYGYDGMNWAVYSVPVPETDEGVTTFHCYSMDVMGNSEAPHSKDIFIDKSDPVIDIYSPEPKAYLTSETVTVDYGVTDFVSGVDTSSADLNGTPVSNGYVIDLDALGGFNTVTVTATDIAGNTASESVAFEVLIDATVELKPEKLNSKSHGVPFAAYISFPPGYDVEMIDVATVVLTVEGQDVPAELTPTAVNDHIRMVQFSRQAIVAALGATTGDVVMTVTGRLTNNIGFVASDTVLVTHPGQN